MKLQAITALLVFVASCGAWRTTRALDCSGQEPLYGSIYDFLQPWMGGITEKHLDGAKERYEGWVTAAYDNEGWPGVEKFPLANLSHPANHEYYPWSSVWLVKIVILDGEVYLPSGNIPPHSQGDAFGNFCFMFALEELVKLSKVVRLPDMTLLTAAGDTPWIDKVQPNGFLPPIFSTSTSRTAFDIALPSCYQVYNPWHSFEPQFLDIVDNDTTPFSEKIGVVVGRNGPACAGDSGVVFNRRRQSMSCPRIGLHNVTHSGKNKDMQLVDIGLTDQADKEWTGLPARAAKNAPYMTMVEQFAYKYIAVLDGRTNAFRAPLNLASHQVPMFVAGTTTQAFYTDALQPWVHYVPVARDSYEDIIDTVHWLNKNEALAAKIAKQSTEFAKKHLVEQGRFCYVSELLHRYAELLQFHPGPLSKYPNAVKLEDAIVALRAGVKQITGEEGFRNSDSYRPAKH